MSSNTDTSHTMSSPDSSDLLTSASDPASVGIQNQHVTMPCSTFTCFPKLSKELQLKIWMHAPSETRNVAVWVNFIALGEIHDGNGDDFPYFFTTSICPPAILHTCQESRSEGLKYYKLSLGATSEAKRPGRPPFTISTPPRTYINWKADRICIMEPRFQELQTAYFSLFEDSKMDDLTRIAFNVQAGGTYNHGLFEILEQAAVWLHELEELILFDTTTHRTRLQGRLTFEDLRAPYAVSDDLDRAIQEIKLAANIKPRAEKEKDGESREGVEEEEGGSKTPYKIQLSRLLCDLEGV